MAYIPLLYSLGWPGMESLPCVVVDHATRDVYSNTNKLPLNKLYLNTTANKYVELSAILKLFPTGKDKDAMHNFMTISSEFGMRKFFMDRFQRAYISLDTLLVYMIVYPYCPEFLQARSEVARFLQSYRELPCCRCGFIKRDCRCNGQLYFGGDDGTYDIVGYATGQITRETQTEFTDTCTSTSHTDSSLHHNVQQKVKTAETKSCSTQTWIAPPSQKGLVAGSSSEKEKPSVKITPINVVAPIKSKPVMVDASCQTRANYDFSVKSRAKTMPSSIIKESESPGTSVFSISNDKAGDLSNGNMKETAPGLGPGLPTNTSNSLLVPKQPLKISLWKLLDSDSSDDESCHNVKDKEKEEEPPIQTLLPRSIDFSNEPKESNTTETLTEMERSLLEEAKRIVLATGQTNDLEGTKVIESVACIEQSKLDRSRDNILSNCVGTKMTVSSGAEQSETGKIELLLQENSDKRVENVIINSLDKPGEAVDELIDTSEQGGKMDTSRHDVGSEKMTPCQSVQVQNNNPENVDVNQLEVIPNQHASEDAVKSLESSHISVMGGNMSNAVVHNTVEESAPEDLNISVEVMGFKGLNESTALDGEMVVKGDKPEGVQFTVRPKTPKQPASSDSPEKSLVIPTKLVRDIKTIDSTHHTSEITKTSDMTEIIQNVDIINENAHSKTLKKISSLSGERKNVEIPVSGDPKSDETPVSGDPKINGIPMYGEPKSDEIPKVSGNRSDDKPKMSYKKWCHKFEYMPTSEKLYRCTFLRCGQCFDTKKAAVVHNKVHGPFGHENPTQIVCFKCDYTTGLNKWFDIVRHLKFKHNELITSHQFGCYLCGRDFDSSEKLNKHIDFHYSGRYKCVHCGAVLFTWKQVEEHIAESCENKEKNEKNLGCPYCPLVFHIRNMRNAHMLSHQDNGLVCAFCDNSEIWENWKQLRKHYQQKHPHKIRTSLNPHRKKEVQDTKASKPALHSFKIDIKRNPVCSVCDEEFEGDEDFFYHMSKRHDFVPYVLSVCEICEKTFRTQKMYDWHMRNTHSEDIKCNKCNFVAKTQAVFKSHMQTRHQDREHVCVECGKDFSHYRELRMHMARHALHTIYCCEVCGEEFKRQRELRHHSATVHPKQNESLQQECLECDYRCYTRRAMEAHVRKYHPKLAEEIEECENEPPPQIHKPEAPAPSIPQRPPKQEAPQEAELTEDAPTNLVIATKPPRSGYVHARSKKSRKKLRKLQGSEPRVLTEKEEEKRRHKRERKEKIEKLRLLMKVSSARTRTYEDFRDMLTLNLIEHPQEQTIDHEKAQIIHSEYDVTEPAQKRQKVSKYGRSIVTKPLDDIYVSGAADSAIEKYVEQPQHLHEKQRRTDAQRRRRATSGLYGALRPFSWADEILEYPFSDHSYFTLESEVVEATNAVSCAKPEEYKAVDDVDVETPSTSLADGQVYRIGPSGVVKKQHNRKQTIKLRAGLDTSPVAPSRSGEFLPLHGDMQASNELTEYGKDIQEEIINQELMREVSEIAQHDPLLQDLINSMQQGNTNNILSSQHSPNDVYTPHTDSPQEPGTSRVVTPPKSLNFQSNLQVFDPTASQGNNYGNLGQLPANTPTKNELCLGTGLTPTKQNVVDFLMSKLGSSELEDIDVNDEELKLLLNEHLKSEQGQMDMLQKSSEPGQMASVQDQQKKAFEAVDVLGLNPQLPTNESDMNEIEEFVTADGKIVCTSGGSVSGLCNQPVSEMVKLDNPSIASITPLVTPQTTDADQMELAVNREPVAGSPRHQILTNKAAQCQPEALPTSPINSPTAPLLPQSSGIDALLEASELTDLNQLASKTYHGIDKKSMVINTSEASDNEMKALNQGLLMNQTDIDVTIEEEISTETRLSHNDGSDTDSSPDKDMTDNLEQSQLDSELSILVKGSEQIERVTEPSSCATVSVGGPALPQSQLTARLASGKQHIVVQHMLQEPATVSVVPSTSQHVVVRPNPSATTVKLIRGPSRVNYHRTAVQGSVMRGVGSSRVLPHFQHGSIVTGGCMRPAHRVVRLASPGTSQSQVISLTSPSTQQPPTRLTRQLEATKPATKIIRIIQKPTQINTHNPHVHSPGMPPSSTDH